MHRRQFISSVLCTGTALTLGLRADAADAFEVSYSEAEWREMLPWIRGWGADVEVLDPADLRDEMMGESKRLASIYGWQT